MAEDKQGYSGRQLLTDMWSFIRPYKARFWLATILRFTSDLVWLYPAWALGEITNFFVDFRRGENLERFWILLGGWAAVGVYRFVVIEIAKFNGYQLAERIGLDSRLKTLRHLFSLDLKWHETMRSGAKLKRIQRGGEGMHQILRIFYTNILESVLNIVAVTIILRNLGVTFVIGFCLYIISYYWFSYLQTKRAEHQSIVVSEKEEELEGVAFESINNILTIKTLGVADAIHRYLTGGVNRLMKEIRTRIGYFRVREGSLNTYTTLTRLAGFAYIGYGIFEGRFEVGLLVMFHAYFDLVWRATAELAEVTNEVAIHKVGVARMQALMAVRPTIEGRGTVAFPAEWQQVGIERVSFAYRKRKVIQNMNLVIRRGEKVGIIGPSGAGKSTLFRILLKLYEDYEGAVRVDGMSLKEIDRASYVERVAVVLQETELFDVSLQDNITIVSDRDYADEKALARALSIAHLDELLPQLPQGVDTLIGEKGIRLSGGEKQRLGIARAVYKNPEILFLDEATSHLDADSERKIQDSLQEFFKGGLTAIVIAHRLSTIKQMDRIVVLDKGKIVEEGTFEGLLGKRGTFYRLWERQKL